MYANVFHLFVLFYNGITTITMYAFIKEVPDLPQYMLIMEVTHFDDSINKFKHPFTCIVAGPTKVGKTEWVLKLVQYADTLIVPPPERIVWCYAEWQSKYNILMTNPKVVLQQGLPSKEELKSTNVPQLLVLDDMMDTMKDDKQLIELFIKGCHHWNISCLHICQSLFFSGLRTLRINAHYFVLLKSPADKLQITTLARQMFPGQSKLFLQAYNEATAIQYGYFIVDCNPECEEKFRLRSNIFPTDRVTTFWIIE